MDSWFCSTLEGIPYVKYRRRAFEQKIPRRSDKGDLSYCNAGRCKKADGFIDTESIKVDVVFHLLSSVYQPVKRESILDAVNRLPADVAER